MVAAAILNFIYRS